MPDLSTVMQRPSYSMLDASTRGIGILRPESGCLSEERSHREGFDHDASPTFRERDRSKILRLIRGLARLGQPSHPGIRPEVERDPVHSVRYGRQRLMAISLAMGKHQSQRDFGSLQSPENSFVREASEDVRLKSTTPTQGFVWLSQVYIPFPQAAPCSTAFYISPVTQNKQKKGGVAHIHATRGHCHPFKLTLSHLLAVLSSACSVASLSLPSIFACQVSTDYSMPTLQSAS